MNSSLSLIGWKDSEIKGVFHTAPVKNKYAIGVENLPYFTTSVTGGAYNEVVRDYAITNLSDMAYAENWKSPVGTNPSTGQPYPWTAFQWYGGQNGANVSIIMSHGHPTMGSMDASTTLFSFEIFAENYNAQRALHVGAGNTPYNTGAIQMNHLLLLSCNVGNYIGWSGAINPGNVGGQNQSVLACKKYLTFDGSYRFTGSYLVSLSQGKPVEMALKELIAQCQEDYEADENKKNGLIVGTSVNADGTCNDLSLPTFGAFALHGDPSTTLKNVYLGSPTLQSTLWWRAL